MSEHQAEEQMYSTAIGGVSRSANDLIYQGANLAISLALSNPAPVEVSVYPGPKEWSAEDELSFCRNALKEGATKDDLQQMLEIGHNAQDTQNPKQYAEIIVNYAHRENLIELNPIKEASQGQSQEMQR
jgi:hypothetical protein